MSEKNNSLELYIAEGLKAIDPNSRPTKGSGSATEVGDVSNLYFFVEAKQKHNKENIIIDYKEEWLTLTSRMSLQSKKIPVIATENVYGDKFITMSAEDFLTLAIKAFGKNDQN